MKPENIPAAPRRPVRAYLALALCACGGDATPPPTDAATGDAPTGSACTHVEAADATNDGAPEAVSASFGDGFTLCGDTRDGDADTFSLIARQDGTLLVALTVPDGAEAARARFLLLGETTAFAASGEMQQGRAVAMATVVAGRYQLYVDGLGGGATATPYRFEVVADSPDQRCPRATGTPAYVEALDGAQSTGNDVLEPASAPPWILTAVEGDAPEPTGVIAAAGAPMDVRGVSASVAQTGDYRDRDTFLVRTGPTTNQLTVRLDPDPSGADLDLALFRADSTDQVAVRVDRDPVDRTTLAVLPDTDYWLWVGGRVDSADPPGAYDLTVCGERVDP